MSRIIVDARGRAFQARPFRRIVSLVPSWTETLFAFGRGESLVAITDYCVEPKNRVLRVPKIGGTKNPRLSEIIALHPDLVIANVEENRKADINKLDEHGIPVFVTFARTVNDGIKELNELGALLCAANVARIVEPIEAEYRSALMQEEFAPRPRVFVAIWKDPWMTANGDTFISDMIELCGGENIFRDRARRFPLASDLGLTAPREILGERDTRYPRVSIEEIAQHAPEIILLPDEPYPFSDADVEEWRGRAQIPAGQNERVILLDGKVLSWYGVRIGENIKTLRAILYGPQTTNRN